MPHFKQAFPRGWLCPGCGKNPTLNHRVLYEFDNAFVPYRCGDCYKEIIHSPFAESREKDRNQLLTRAYAIFKETGSAQRALQWLKDGIEVSMESEHKDRLVGGKIEDFSAKPISGLVQKAIEIFDGEMVSIPEKEEELW